MTESRIIIVLISLISFLVGFLFAYEDEKYTPIEEKNSENVIKKRIFFGRVHPSSESQISNVNSSSQYDFAGFALMLKKKLSPEEYEALFEEILLIDKILPFDRRRMNLLLHHWADASPRHALDSILEYKGAEYWVYTVFNRWASRNPEEAAAYYEDSVDRNIKGNGNALSAIACQWALHDLDMAWKWLQSQKGQGIFTEEFEWGKKMLVETIAKVQSDKIPNLLEKLDAKAQEENAYELAKNWPQSVEGLDEWIQQLPENGQNKAEAGRIIQVAQGDFQKIKEEVAKLDTEKQVKVALEVIEPVFWYGGNDMGERVEWYLDTLPDELIKSDLKYHIQSWFREDNGKAREWIESLPENKKIRMINLINSSHGSLRY